MEHLNAGDARLCGRFAHTIRVEPFDYFDAAALAPVPSPQERAIAYGIVGGTPRYLRAFQADRSLQENVAAEVLGGLRKTDEYKAILRGAPNVSVSLSARRPGIAVPRQNGLAVPFRAGYVRPCGGLGARDRARPPEYVHGWNLRAHCG